MNAESDFEKNFERRRQRPLVLEVRDELERMILGGQMRAGERLNEYSLAEQMGVSRGPVREAARSLERDGLVTTVSNQGVFVRSFSTQDGLELFDLSAMVAGYVCACSAERAPQETKSELRSFVDRMGKIALAEDEDAYLTANLELQVRIARASGAGRAKTIYIALGKELRLMRQQNLRGKLHLIAAHAEQERVVTAIQHGDATTANQAITQHYLNEKKRLSEAPSGQKIQIQFIENEASPHDQHADPHR